MSVQKRYVGRANVATNPSRPEGEKIKEGKSKYRNPKKESAVKKKVCAVKRKVKKEVKRRNRTKEKGYACPRGHVIGPF